MNSTKASATFIKLAVLFSVFTSPLLAQAPPPSESTGAPLTIYRGTSLENVNLTSGNLRITIPLLSLPGRGLDTSVVLSYNSKIWQTTPWFDEWGQVLHYETDLWECGVVSYCGNGNAFGFGTLGKPSFPVAPGWAVGIPGMSRYHDSWDYCGGYSSQGYCNQWAYYTERVMTDGTRVTFADENGYLPDCCFGGVTGYWTFDGSYQRVSIPGNPPVYTVKTKNGSTSKEYFDTTQNKWTYLLQDTNGNFITCTQELCKDTLGREISSNFPSTYLQTLTYKDSSGTVQTISFSYQMQTVYFPWNPYDPLHNERYESVPILTRVTLPNGRSYQFEYLNNPDGSTTGEIAKLILSTGGYIRYNYTPTDGGQYRYVNHRYVSEDGTSGSEKTWTHTWTNSQGGQLPTQSDPLGNIEVHYWTGVPGLGTRNIEYKNPSGVLLKKVEYPLGADASSYFDPSGTSPSNERFTSATTTLNDTNQKSKVEFTYGTHGNVTEKKEYGWGSGVVGPLIRRTTYAYLHNSQTIYADKTVHILDRPITQIIYDASGNIQTQTNTTYDSAAPAATSGVVQHDYVSHPASYTRRGNPTVVSRWRNTTGTWLSTTNTYNDLGNVLTTTDPGAHVTSFSYADNFYAYTPPQPTLAFVTQVTAPTTGTVSHIERTQYYFHSGLPAASCGENFGSGACAFAAPSGQSDFTTHTYDLLNRPVATTTGDGGQKALTYNEASLPISIGSTTRIDASQNLLTTSIYDGRGRLNQTQLNSNPGCVVKTDFTYDALDRQATQSNPYCLTSEPTYGITTYQYDALNRITRVVPPDGNVTTGANSVSTSYSGNCTTVTDQAGKLRKSCTDALGRLTQLFEPNQSGSLVNETAYQYGALDNLICVVQKGTDTSPFTTCASAPAGWRPRSFTYNSLSQLLTASNPESGTISYAYDNDGNLVTKVAPAPNQTGSATVTTTFSYDALHRLTQRSYSDATPVVKYGYDAVAPSGCTPPTLTITNGIGRRTGMCDGAGAEAWSYDPMGRPLTDRRLNFSTPSNVTKDTLYTYNLDGSVATLTYPSGRVITYSYNAAARATSAVDTANSINYATAAGYAPTGALASLTNGASLVGTFYYNSRLQPCRISVKSSGTAPANCADAANIGGILDFTYGFNAGTANNGNVASIANNRNTARSQSFTYDELNRIKAAQTSSTTGQYCWGETFSYDIWANLLTIGALTGYTGCTQESGLGVVATAKNQISGFCYDTAGNLLAQSAPPCPVPTYSYNAENQLTQTAGMTYLYDGDGKRVEKATTGPPLAPTKLYWYGMGTGPLAETDAAGTPSTEFVFFNGKRTSRLDLPGAAVHYYFSDHLGSASVVTSAAGTIQDESDYYPFGGERIVTNTDPNQYKFTGKERDPESGLDFFGARYYSSNYGRFFSPDEFTGGPVDAYSSNDPLPLGPLPYADIANPQSLNKYTYTYNNPLRWTDANGHCVFTPIDAAICIGVAALIGTYAYSHFTVLHAKAEAAKAAKDFAEACAGPMGANSGCDPEAARRQALKLLQDAGLEAQATGIAVVPTTGVPTTLKELVIEGVIDTAKEAAIEEAQKKAEERRRAEEETKRKKEEEEARKRMEEEQRKKATCRHEGSPCPR